MSHRTQASSYRRLAGIAVGLAGAALVLSAAQDPAGRLAAARQALGGDAALSAVTSFIMTGSLTHEVEGRRTDSRIEIDCVLPDKFVEFEQQSLTLGPLGNGEIDYTRGFNGDAPIYDVHAIGPVPPPPASTGRSADPYKRSFMMLTLPMFAASFAGAPLTFARAADADAVEATGIGGAAWRLFFDPATHLLVRITWMGKPIVSFSTSSMTAVSSRGPVRTSDQPPALPANPTAGMADVPWELVAGGFKRENGLNWPRTLTRSYDGKKYETMRIDTIKINPRIDLKRFK